MLSRVLVGVDGTPSGRDAVVLARALAAGADADVVLLEADVSPGRALCHAIADARADLLVLGSSRRVPDGRAGAGRTGRQALHGAGCAVALAARGLAAAAPEGFAPRRIVVGVDRSPEADAALALAHALAGASGAALTAVGGGGPPPAAPRAPAGRGGARVAGGARGGAPPGPSARR
ncbi:MAG: hypothetical protein ACTHOE_13895, partial [Conexibacter sp.]